MKWLYSIIICLLYLTLLSVCEHTSEVSNVVSVNNKNIPTDVNKDNQNNANPKVDEIVSWVGKYYFSEFVEPNQNMFYDIEVYSSNDVLMADIYINGYQTMQRYQAKVVKDGNRVNLNLCKYLDDNRFEPYEVGDTLLTFEKSDEQLKTYWIKIKPLIVDYPESKTDYFELIKE